MSKGVPAKRKRRPRRLDNSRRKELKELTLDERERLKGKIAPITCSAAWTDAVADAAEAAGLHPTSHHIRKDLHRTGIYPPADPAPRKPKRRRPTLMRRCETCDDRFFPPQYLGRRWDEDGQLHRRCAECGAIAALPPEQRDRDYTNFVTTESPSAIAIQELERRGLMISEPSVRAGTGNDVRRRGMASEDDADLLEEIRIFDESGWVVETYVDAARHEKRAVYVKRDPAYLDAMRAKAAAAAQAA